jgi:hypothetical protein
MRLRTWLALGVLGALATSIPMGASAEKPADVDQYGGYRDLPVPGRATGFFRLAKINKRWIFATPDGNAFWLRSVYMLHTMDGGPTYHAVVGGKYSGLGSWPAIFGQQARRMKAWGFNALDYADPRAWPTVNPEKLPFIHTIQGSLYAAWEHGAVANLYVGVDGATSVYRGAFADVFSPQWAGAIDGMLAYQKANDLGPAGPKYPWLLGFNTDDGDYTTGFGPGPEAAATQGKTHPHLGWVAAVTSPAQSGVWGTPRGTKVTLKDPKIYTKYAWRDFLRTKYGSVAALNTAWGSSYTTWDSDGGWPSGRGVLDESGRWVGRDFDGTDASRKARPALWADLDAFLEQIADRYFAAYKAARDKHYPNHLLFTPAPMQAGTRVPILRATGRHVDAIQSAAVPGGANNKWYQRACDESGKPLFVWLTFTAQTDSNLKPGFAPAGWGGFNFPTQALRGQAYARELEGLLNLRASDGTACVVGIDWWEWTDKVIGGENMNFGLVTNLDNAYDGREARVAGGTDRFGYRTGGETRDYGDFLSAVKNAHDAIAGVLKLQLGNAAGQAR